MALPGMGLYRGRHGLYAGRRGLYAGPKYHSGAFELALPGLLAWWSPRDASTVTLVGSPADDVSQIDDKSGNGGHLAQATARVRPQYPAEIGNVVGFHCSVNDACLSSTIQIGASQTVACVVKRPASLANQDVLGTGASTVGDLGFSIGIRWDGTFLLRISDGTTSTQMNNNDIPNITYAVDEVMILMLTWDGANMTFRKSGQSASKAATEDPTQSGNFAFGKQAADINAFDFIGVCGDALICDALTTEQQAALEAHWAAIYGVTLP